MKKLIISLGLLIFAGQSMMAQEDMKGLWWAEKDKVKVEVYEKSPGILAGKIVWLAKATDKKGNPLTDKKNPDKSLRDRPLMGLHLLDNVRQEDGEWKGTIYSPQRGRTVDVKLELDGTDQLDIKVSMMGMSRTRTWTRASE